MLSNPRAIHEGLALYFNHARVFAHPGVKPQFPVWHGTPPARDAPFLCTSVVGPYATWLPLTSVERPERLALLPEWRLFGSKMWHSDQALYVRDAATLYLGTLDAWVELSAADFNSNPGELTPEGMTHVEAEVRRQAHRRTEVTLP